MILMVLLKGNKMGSEIKLTNLKMTPVMQKVKQGFCKGRMISWQKFDENFLVVPCDGRYPLGPGFAVIKNDLLSILQHLNSYVDFDL